MKILSEAMGSNKLGTIISIRQSIDKKQYILQVKWNDNSTEGYYLPYGFTDNHLYNVTCHK